MAKIKVKNPFKFAEEYERKVIAQYSEILQSHSSKGNRVASVRSQKEKGENMTKTKICLSRQKTTDPKKKQTEQNPKGEKIGVKQNVM